MACSTFAINKCLISTHRITKLKILSSVEVRVRVSDLGG